MKNPACMIKQWNISSTFDLYMTSMKHQFKRGQQSQVGNIFPNHAIEHVVMPYKHIILIYVDISIQFLILSV